MLGVRARYPESPMSILEYAASILSIVLGLGVAHLLGGIAWMVRNPKNSALFYAFGIWCVAVLLSTLGWWWAIWLTFRDLDVLSFWEFLPAFLISTLLYLAGRILVPPSTELSVGLDENFPLVAKPFCLCVAGLFSVSAISSPVPAEFGLEAALGFAIIGIALSGVFAKTPQHHIYVALGWLCVYLAQQTIQPDIA
jgi:hypothetical protein